MNRQIETDRFTAGLEKLGEIDGKAGQEVIHGLQDIAPDLGKYIIEFAFGDISTPATNLISRNVKASPWQVF